MRIHDKFKAIMIPKIRKIIAIMIIIMTHAVYSISMCFLLDYFRAGVLLLRVFLPFLM